MDHSVFRHLKNYWRSGCSLAGLQTEIYGGVENAAGKKYSLGSDLNGFGNRYFNAAPGRNFYTGLLVKCAY